MLKLAAAMLALLAGCAAPARAQPLLADWAVMIVAADETSSQGTLTEGFDNARRELAAAFLAKGAQPANLRQFSVDPARDPRTRPERARSGELDRALTKLTRVARGGCLLYFTSHGDPRGIVLSDAQFSPAEMDALADRHCAGRPTVVVVSACFSGVFIPALAGPERLILTAARPDRSSFGCGQNDRMPYFDQCVLEALPDAVDFGSAGRQAGVCVADLERRGRLRPPSEPQMYVGPEMRVLLPLMRFDG